MITATADIPTAITPTLMVILMTGLLTEVTCTVVIPTTMVGTLILTASTAARFRLPTAYPYPRVSKLRQPTFGKVKQTGLCGSMRARALLAICCSVLC